VKEKLTLQEAAYAMFMAASVADVVDFLDSIGYELKIVFKK